MAISIIWAGGQTDTTAVISVRLTAPATLRAVYSTAADLSNPSYVPILLNVNRVGKAYLFGLAPDTTYYYTVEINGVLDAVRGHFHTLPVIGNPANFTVVLGACSNFGNLPVYDRMAEVGAIGGLHMGDLFYPDIVDEDPLQYFDAYNIHHGQSHARDFWLSTGLLHYVWDDHDSWAGNNGGGNFPGRASAASVYRQVVPHRPLVDDGAVYGTCQIGRVRFIVTDLRYYRDPEADPNIPTKTCLGPVQLQWFLNELRAAHDDPTVGETVWVSSMVWLTDAGVTTDTWARYRYEQRLIGQFIDSLGPPGWLSQLAGDAHWTAIDDGSNNDSASFTTLGPRFPIFQCAPIVGTADSPGKGGPFSKGTYGLEVQNSQFGTMAVVDDGELITVTWKGYRVDTVTGVQTELVSHSFTNVPRPAPVVFEQAYIERHDGIAWRATDTESADPAFTDILSAEVAMQR